MTNDPLYVKIAPKIDYKQSRNHLRKQSLKLLILLVIYYGKRIAGTVLISEVLVRSDGVLAALLLPTNWVAWIGCVIQLLIILTHNQLFVYF